MWWHTRHQNKKKKKRKMSHFTNWEKKKSRNEKNEHSGQFGMQMKLYNSILLMQSRCVTMKFECIHGKWIGKNENYVCTELCNCLDMKRKSKQLYFSFMNFFSDWYDVYAKQMRWVFNSLEFTNKIIATAFSFLFYNVLVPKYRMITIVGNAALFFLFSSTHNRIFYWN